MISPPPNRNQSYSIQTNNTSKSSMDILNSLGFGNSNANQQQKRNGNGNNWNTKSPYNNNLW